MELPYLKHKSFQQKNRYSIFSTYNFNEIYNQIETNKSNWDFIEVQKEIITALEIIFSDLLNQASNSRESLFLEELLFFSKKILVNDLIFFETKKQPPPSQHTHREMATFCAPWTDCWKDTTQEERHKLMCTSKDASMELLTKKIESRRSARR